MDVSGQKYCEVLKRDLELQGVIPVESFIYWRKRKFSSFELWFEECTQRTLESYFFKSLTPLDYMPNQSIQEYDQLNLTFYSFIDDECPHPFDSEVQDVIRYHARVVPKT